jgi:DNA-binding transcriptional regulator PaaX
MSKKSLVKEISFGVLGTMVDFLLWYTALVGASIGESGPAGVHRAFNEADEFIRKVNHRTLAAAWYQLKKKGLLTYKKRGNLYSPEITEFGKKRLAESIPQYHQKRPWDKKIYLIAYDIPENAHYKRDALRNFLKQIGCRLLQESTWLTPYNPRQLTKEFVSENRIPGTIIISDIGKDGGIGETAIQDLLVKLYNLEKLNERYETFIKNVNEKEKSLRGLIFEYLSVLQDDPQLPFELLPSGWLGDKAYSLYQKLTSNYILFHKRPLT